MLMEAKLVKFASGTSRKQPSLVPTRAFTGPDRQRVTLMGKLSVQPHCSTKWVQASAAASHPKQQQNLSCPDWLLTTVVW